MSHFTRIRTQIRERAVLVQALRDLHYQFQEGERVEVKGYAGNREHAEVVVNTGSAYDIGFQRKAEAYEIVADWWGVHTSTRIREEAFVREVNRQYAYRLIHEQAREQNLLVETEQTLENGDLVIVLTERG